MRGHMMMITVDGERTVRTYDKSPSLADLKAGLDGGRIELVPYFNRIEYQGKVRECIAFCNDEGKLCGLPSNQIATNLWYKVAPQMAYHDYLVGPIIVLWGDEAFMRSL